MPKDFRRCVVIHYNEIGLKGRNRKKFEDQLRRNVLRALEDAGGGSVQRFFGRMVLFPPRHYDWEIIKNKLENIFGIANFSPALFLEQNIDEITHAALDLVREYTFSTFRVLTKRGQKDFPMNSQDINILVGSEIQKMSGADVNLDSPELTCYIEIFNKNALVYADKYPGQGGLPSGVSERAVALLSSGIDSPVAAFKLMRRGVKVNFVHFHSVPATSEASIQNTVRIVERLTRFQYKSRLYLVPILPIQNEIRVEAPDELRIIFYRRCMFRLAEKIAGFEKAKALITGENVGQVASQTLSNILVISDGISLPVFRPLIGEDKLDIIRAARKLGTYSISTEPYEDCCSLFVPQHPETRSSGDDILEIERYLNLDPLLEEALKSTEIRKFRYPTVSP